MMTSIPKIIQEPREIRTAVLESRQTGWRVGLVPTMGALHAGHLSLVDASADECDLTVVTIFVNPTQFGPGEDLQKYPRDLDADVALLAPHGADLVFAPSVDAMYPPGHTTFVEPGGAALPLEGEHRPGHFRGVATIVLKLFNLCPADVAYFGQKDYQQTLVVRQMVADLEVPIEIRVCPTVREPDGLALSSRNAYLSADERRRALAISQGLRLAADWILAGERDAAEIQQRLRSNLASADLTIDYIAIVRDGTVQPVEQIDGPVVIAIAAKVGETRLIDNVRVTPTR